MALRRAWDLYTLLLMPQTFIPDIHTHSHKHIHSSASIQPSKSLNPSISSHIYCRCSRPLPANHILFTTRKCDSRLPASSSAAPASILVTEVHRIQADHQHPWLHQCLPTMRSRVMAARELTYQHTCPSNHALKWTDAMTPLVGPLVLGTAINSINRSKLRTVTIFDFHASPSSGFGLSVPRTWPAIFLDIHWALPSLSSAELRAIAITMGVFIFRELWSGVIYYCTSCWRCVRSGDA